MKKISLFIFLFLSIGYSKNTFSQKIEKADSLGLPGDNLNLYAVLDLFQKSETFDVFEKKLNSEDSKVNNLDLNNDDKIDYIKVIDHQTGEAHAIVLQVPINEKETQDVAVIEIDKDKSGKVIVQIIGNEALYGKDYIVEPTENDPAAKTVQADPNKKSDTTVSADGKTVIINNTTNNYNTTTTTVADNSPDYIVVSNWPIVHYVYGPTYVVYASPWYWHSYPMWWNPWTPWYWHNYYWHHYDHYHYHHYGYYHRTTYYRAPVANAYYGPRRSASVTVEGNRKTKVYQRTYASKSPAGDGRINGNTNPAFKGNAENKSNNNNIGRKENNSNNGVGRQKPNEGMNKPYKQNESSGRKENKGTNNKANSTPRQNNNQSAKPASKPPVQKQNGGSRPTSKGGGGRMGR